MGSYANAGVCYGIVVPKEWVKNWMKEEGLEYPYEEELDEKLYKLGITDVGASSVTYFGDAYYSTMFLTFHSFGNTSVEPGQAAVFKFEPDSERDGILIKAAKALGFKAEPGMLVWCNHS